MKIGNGEFWLGDCLKRMRDIPDGSVDMIATDPPYRNISGGKNGADGFGWRTSVVSKNDGKVFADNNIKSSDYLPECYRVLKPGTHIYVMSNLINLRFTADAMEAAGFHIHNLLRWDKNTKTANRWYMKDCEWTLFGAKRPTKRITRPGSTQGFAANNPRNKRHPTEKPVELMEHYILNSSNPDDLILDPFGGSGTTAIAAERTGRRWLCIERDPGYYYPAVGRVWGELQGS